jgi:urease accessory protein
MMHSSARSSGYLAFVAAIAASVPAHAHHAMDGCAPETLAEGFLSGLAHPVIGLDHLLAVVALGALAARFRAGAAAAILFVLATILGTAVHQLEVDIPAVELVIALSVVGFGAALAFRTASTRATWLSVAALLAGLAHGYAYGESIVGAEASPLSGYLLGFATVQVAIILAAMRVARPHASSPPIRITGAVVAAAGVVFVALAAV